MKISEIGICGIVFGFVNFTAGYFGVPMTGDYFMGYIMVGIFLFLIGLFVPEEDSEGKQNGDRTNNN